MHARVLGKLSGMDFEVGSESVETNLPHPGRMAAFAQLIDVCVPAAMLLSEALLSTDYHSLPNLTSRSQCRLEA